MSYCDCKEVEHGNQYSESSIRVLSDDGSRVIGTIKDSTFTKSNWHSTKHLCWKHKAIGLDLSAFLYQVEPFATQMVVQDKDTGREYTVSVEDFKRFAIEDNLGWGAQLFLPLKYWEVTKPDGNRPLQLSLWGGGNG